MWLYLLIFLTKFKNLLTNTLPDMKRIYILLYFTLLGSFLFGQSSTNRVISNKNPYYFFSLFYGFQNDVYISDVYVLEMERSDIYKNNKARYEQVKNYIIEKGFVDELQSGLEKNYSLLEQAINEREHLMDQLKKQEFKIISFKYE